MSIKEWLLVVAMGGIPLLIAWLVFRLGQVLRSLLG